MLAVHVTTRPVNSKGPAVHRVIDHDNTGDRRWLGKHAYWAMRNGHSVTTYPTDEQPQLSPRRAE